MLKYLVKFKKEYQWSNVNGIYFNHRFILVINEDDKFWEVSVKFKVSCEIFLYINIINSNCTGLGACSLDTYYERLTTNFDR